MSIKQNVGQVDRFARIVGGLGMLYAATIPGNMTPDLFGVVGVAAVLTGALGYCPLYAALNLQTTRPHAHGHS